MQWVQILGIIIFKHPLMKFMKNILKMVRDEICKNQYLYRINQENYVLFLLIFLTL